MSLFDLSGKTALVTGGSRGLGHAIAQGLGQAGARIVLNGRGVAALETAAEGLRAAGIAADVLAFDVTDHAAVRTAVDGYEADTGPIDILVNNAGMQARAPLEDFDPATFDQILRTNVSSAFHVGQACARHMLARGQGKIINIGSVQSRLGRKTITPYAASKGAMLMLTQSMSAEWAGRGINVNGIGPGYFKTELNEALWSDPEFTAWLEMRTPQGRWGRVEELQGAAVFLASDASSFVNGHMLFVDGGLTTSV